MELLELTLATPAENLALDEALLAKAEAAEPPREVLRLWESPQTAVVVGRSSNVAEEVDLPECERRGVSVWRRPSGGAAVAVGPGCLMYSLVLNTQSRPELKQIDAAHQFVLGAIVRSLGRHVPHVDHHGTSDLAVGSSRPAKFSGNSLRCRKSNLLYHGTLLYEFPLDVIAACLRSPPRQPEYRSGRDHESFVTNLALPRPVLRQSLIDAFATGESTRSWPRALVADLVATRYSQPSWNLEGQRRG